uniref:Uncharacterized protein n=1 Tax=Myoviridae sp. ctxZR60 TaxID=2826712 RepID=A0A8S5MVE4_9CAUD|nr:MAG TPA: hypothetical protein [Myoviridae sp. ctxZR60]
MNGYDCAADSAERVGGTYAQRLGARHKRGNFR